MTTTDTLSVEVAYAGPEHSLLLALEISPGTTAREAVLQSALAAHFPEADFQAAPLGVFGKTVADDYVLQAGERVEIYRPLLIDPKENRRRRAAGG